MTAELTESHRLIQAQLGSRTAVAVLRLWDLLDVDNLDTTMARWVDTITRLVEAERAQSAEIAGRYVATHRQLSLGSAAPPAPLVDIRAFRPEALRTSLLVTGPYRLRKNLSKGVAFDRAVDMARADSAGESMRHVLSGARDTIIGAANSDRAVEGVQRVTSSSPCSFCAMLASRGAAYLTEGTADFQPHSRCGCQPELVYSRTASMAPQAERFQAQWRDAKRLAGEQQISPEVAFRRLHESRA